MENLEYPYGRFNFDVKKLTDLIPETGGIPIRSVIITTWRSGSTFLGEILNSIPGNFYLYEPLAHFNVTQIHGPPNDKKAIGHIKKVLNCDFTDMDEYFKYLKYEENHDLFTRYHSFFGIKAEKCTEFCFESKFLNSYYKLFPLQTMKIVRLRLALAEQQLSDTSNTLEPNIKEEDAEEDSSSNIRELFDKWINVAGNRQKPERTKFGKYGVSDSSSEQFNILK